MGVQKADQKSTMKALLEHIIPMMGWPLTVYTDNGSHFTGCQITKMWGDHGVIHFPSALSHPQSVGLSERYVQMLIGRIRLRCISLGSSVNWGLEIRNAVLSINTCCIRVHGYTPAEILLGFNPTITWTTELDMGDWAKGDLLQDGDVLKPSYNNIMDNVDIWEERCSQPISHLAQSQEKVQPVKTSGYRKPKVGDLVLLRDFQLAKDNGRKLDPRWSTPHLLVKISKSEVSAYVWQLHDPPGATKRFHFDDLLVYIPRTGTYAELGAGSRTEKGVEYVRGAMGVLENIGIAGQRAFDLSDLG